MLSMPDKEIEIKSALMEQLEAISGFITQSVAEKQSAHAVEEGIWQQILSLGHQAFGLFLKHSGTGDQGEVIHLDEGRRLKRLKQMHTRSYLTVFGEFSLPRCVYGSREGQQIEQVPLDALLQLPAQKFSYLLQDWDQCLATELPFGKVNGCLSRILGFQQSVNSLERTASVMSDQTTPFWEAVKTPPPKEEGDLLVVSADGKGVIMRPRELTADATNKEAKRPGNKKMSLVGSVYSVDAYKRTPDELLAALFREPCDKDTLPTRPTPCHKRVRAALLRNDLGKTDPQSAAIFSWIAEEVKQRDPEKKKPLVLIMDGQESLWNSGCEHLPATDFTVIEVLDVIHATAYIWEATHLFFKKKSAAATLYAKEKISQLLNNNVMSVVTSFRDKAKSKKLSTAKYKKLDSVCGYLKNQAPRMRYRDYLEKGYPIASGVIEGACRNVVKDRMEHSGMRWTMKGAHAVLSLRSIQLSGLWDEFIQWRRHQETQHLYPMQAANDPIVSLARTG